jgi:predicted RND superfamily exporter protein
LTAALNGLWWQLSTAASGSAAMLFGVGIDGVLLLYVRYLEERGKGLGAEAAIGNLSATTVSMMMGFTTTAATYFALMLIDFPSLEEVGRLIGTAILISGFLTIAIVPALLPRKLSSRRRWCSEWPRSVSASSRRFRNCSLRRRRRARNESSSGVSRFRKKSY